MKTYYSRITSRKGSSRTHKRFGISDIDLIKQIEDSNQLMASLYESDKVCEPLEGIGVFANDFTGVDIKMDGAAVINAAKYRGLRGLAASDEFKKDLKKLAAKNARLLYNLKHNRINPGVNYYTASIWQSGMTIARATIFDGFTCTRCGTITDLEDKIKHELGGSCHDKISPPTGYVPFSSSELSAISKTGIKYVFIPNSYGVYGPSWVVDAIKLYRSSKGYSDMSLSEYLAKMADEHAEDNQ